MGLKPVSSTLRAGPGTLRRQRSKVTQTDVVGHDRRSEAGFLIADDDADAAEHATLVACHRDGKSVYT